MSTRAKLYISSYAASIMMMLNVFSKPLHISEGFQWILIIGVFVPLGFTFYFMRQQKQEQNEQAWATGVSPAPPADERHKAKKRLGLVTVIGCIVGLCSPWWLPFTGTTLGVRGDFVIGFITAATVCAIGGFRFRQLNKSSTKRSSEPQGRSMTYEG